MADSKFYGQAQIYTTESGMVCPLCNQEVLPKVGHYCEIRQQPKEARKDGN